MNLFDLSWRNVKRNFRTYSIYLISIIIGVIIQFTFTSLMFNEDILAAVEHEDNFQIGIMVSSVAVFLSIIFFILYANSFFMNQRKKEFGMYILYGMSERQIALMIFMETLILSTISIVSGILIGGLLSKLFGSLLMSLMQYDKVISFAFPIQAILSTAFLLAVLISIVSLQSYITYKRIKLVELFQSHTSNKKNSGYSIILTGLSVLLLGAAYFLISRDGDTVFWDDWLIFSLIISTIGIIGGTYLFFRQFSAWLLDRISKRKNYYEGNKMLWTSSLRFSISGNTLNLTFITLFSTIIIILVGFVSINYAVQFDGVAQNNPNHIAVGNADDDIYREIEETTQQSDHDIINRETIEGIHAMPLSDMSAAFHDAPYFTNDILLFSETQFNEIVSLRGDDEIIDLKERDAVALSKGSSSPEVLPQSEIFGFTVDAGEEENLNIVGRKDYALLGQPTSDGGTTGPKPAVFIISNELFESINNTDISSYNLYEIENASRSGELSSELRTIVFNDPDIYYAAFSDVYSLQIELSSMLLFTAAFLAVIALFALGSIIYFKQLREATEERSKYTVLRKMGVGDKEIKNVIRKQLFFTFLPPLILGILHSFILMNYTILHEVRDFPQLTSILAAVFIVYFLIYTIFYISSVNVYYQIINQDK